MATRTRNPRRKPRRPFALPKPRGTLNPRVQKAGPEHFGVVSVDCAKHRSKWMLCDFYGNSLIPPTEVYHTKQGLQEAIRQLRQAITDHDLRDHIVAVERTGSYHLPVKRTFVAAGFEVRTVHPYATKQFRLVANPGNKTDDTDLVAIFQAAVNGFGLLEPPLDLTHGQLRLLARHRRDLVRKNSALRCQIHVELDALMPGFARCFGDIVTSEVPLVIARATGSAAAVQKAGLTGLAKILKQAGVRYQEPTLAKILAWANQAHEGLEHPAIHLQIMNNLYDDLVGKARIIKELERALAGLLVCTPYVLLLSFPAINVVSASEFAGEMGQIEHYAQASSITGRAGLFPSRYQSDQVDHADGPLVRSANRDLRYVIMYIADNLATRNNYFRGLADQWRVAGRDPGHTRVKIAGRFCRIAYQMVAGRQVFKHPSCQERHAILDKLNAFHREHETPMQQVMTDLQAAANQIPAKEHAAEAVPLLAALNKAPSRRRNGPCSLGEILPAVLAKLGVPIVQSTTSGETDLT
jgi:transposase